MADSLGVAPHSNAECFEAAREMMIEYWGERCEQHEDGCWCCDMWAYFDRITVQARGGHSEAQ